LNFTFIFQRCVDEITTAIANSCSCTEKSTPPVNSGYKKLEPIASEETKDQTAFLLNIILALIVIVLIFVVAIFTGMIYYYAKTYKIFPLTCFEQNKEDITRVESLTPMPTIVSSEEVIIENDLYGFI
jgi:heme/copper-type cytochrome/quinol oxidase subunit 2